MRISFLFFILLFCKGAYCQSNLIICEKESPYNLTDFDLLIEEETYGPFHVIGFSERTSDTINIKERPLDIVKATYKTWVPEEITSLYKGLYESELDIYVDTSQKVIDTKFLLLAEKNTVTRGLHNIPCYPMSITNTSSDTIILETPFLNIGREHFIDNNWVELKTAYVNFRCGTTLGSLTIYKIPPGGTLLTSVFVDCALQALNKVRYRLGTAYSNIIEIGN